MQVPAVTRVLTACYNFCNKILNGEVACGSSF
jgi:hypothetical protein